VWCALVEAAQKVAHAAHMNVLRAKLLRKALAECAQAELARGEGACGLVPARRGRGT
jgi:hypothetical protein